MSRANGLTRQEVLTALKHHGSLTAEALARHLGISTVAVRQHLDGLEAQELVMLRVQRGGVGRPSHYYRLTVAGDAQFPRRYAETAASLIEELNAWQGEAAVQTLFARRREKETWAHQERLRYKTARARVEEVARIQSESGHMACIQEGEEPGEYLLVQHNCALCSLARRIPHVCCESELQMLRDLLPDMRVERQQHLLKGDHVCTYRLRTTQSENRVGE